MKKILVVDDKTENLYLMQAILEGKEFKSITARNGAEALGLMRTEKPDLIISDILMPVMDGFSLCMECKKDAELKHIPFIFYTATYTDSRDEEYAMGLGADMFILKPKDPEEFLKIIVDFLSGTGRKKIRHKEEFSQSETVILKEYNQVLVRKLEDKMIQSEKTETDLRNYAEKLEIEIRERKKAEDSLLESQALFRTLAEVSPVGIFRTTPNGETTYVNPKWCELSGLSQDDALGKGWLKAVHPDDRHIVSDKWSGDSKKGQDSSAEYRFLKPDKSIVWVLGKAVPEKINDTIMGYVGTITDITERKLAEDKLKNSEERLKILFEYAPDAYYLCDHKGNFINGNIAAEKILGYSREELIGKSFLKLKLLQSKDLPRAASLLLKNSLGSSTGPDIFTLRHKDGSKVTVEIIAHPVKIDGKMLILGIARDITERIRSEEALVESESKYRHLVMQSPDGIFIADLSGKFMSANKAICETLGYSEKELLEMYLLDIVPEKYHLMHKERLSAVLKGEMNASTVEYEVTGKNGKKYFVEVISVPYFRNNKIVGFQGIARNISERKRIENKLRESEARFRSYFNTSLAGIAITSDTAGWLDVNEAVCKMLGYERDELIGMKWTDITYPEDLTADLDLFNKVLDNKLDGYYIDKRFIRKDGQIIWTSLSVSCLRSTDGSILYFVALMLDITERKRTEEALRNSQHLLNNALRIASMGAWEYDVESDLFIFNDLFYRIYGYTAEKVGKYTMSASEYANMFVHPDDLAVVEQEIRKALDTEDVKYSPQLEHRSILANGEMGYVKVRISVIKDKSGKTVHVIGVNQDITEQKRIEDELIRSKEKAEESDRLKTAFLHNISHEIRTPMNAITGFTALLSEPGMDEATKNSFIETITQSSDQLLNIINDILEVSNIDAGIIKLAKTRIEVNSVIKSVYNQFNPLAVKKNLGFSYSCPLKDDEAVVISDKTKLVQVISNLVNNAFKFTSTGKISLGYDIIAGNIRFFISDTGIGILEDNLDKIFDRFYQVDHGLERQYEGTGLGLSICKSYITLLGGDIWVSSSPGKGSVFYFTLPFDKKTETAPVQKPDNTENEFTFQNTRKILVAEDIESNFLLINYFLKNLNTVIYRARNGKEAVDLALSIDHLDLILMDIKMPEMDGYEATRIIHNAKPGIPILAQSAYADDKSKILGSGCSGFITKPFDKKKLLDAVREFIS